jgi:hypothetical protein
VKAKNIANNKHITKARILIIGRLWGDAISLGSPGLLYGDRQKNEKSNRI